MKKTVYATLVMLLALTASVFAAYDLKFDVTLNDMSNGGNFDVKVQIASSSGTFNMGTSSLVFTYNTSALTAAPLTFTPHAFSGTFYNAMTVTEPVLGRISVNIDLALANMGTLVDTPLLDVVTIRFSIINKDLGSGLVWRTTSPNACTVYHHDQATLISSGTLIPLDTTLPVELGNFAAANVNGVVKLSWTTQSEMNNIGFNIFRSDAPRDGYEKINGGLIPGAGTSAAQNSYSFVDDRLEQGRTYFYLLEDIDINGHITRHGPLTVAVETVQLPETFYVEQNYPNPFNPRTVIEYGLPEASQVRVLVYNLRGELVRTLVNGLQQPGHLILTWDGTSDGGAVVPTGIYVCRVQAGSEYKAIKMLFAK